MAQPRVLILRAPGTNCDNETAHAFRMQGAVAESIHVNRLIEQPTLGRQFQILCFPGGFSYGDDIAAGRILAGRLNVHLRDLVDLFRTTDRLILGICNGFQIMMRLGVFFSQASSAPPATLTLNRQARFEDRWVNLAVDNSRCIFLRGVTQLYLPMAHAEGRFVIRDEATQKQLESDRQLALRYCLPAGQIETKTLPYPANPNGADLNVAGICDPSGRIFGLMPHPERFVDITQHPFWTRLDSVNAQGEGVAIFKNAVAYFG